METGYNLHSFGRASELAEKKARPRLLVTKGDTEYHLLLQQLKTMKRKRKKKPDFSCKIK